jgi:hypothetical protein
LGVCSVLLPKEEILWTRIRLQIPKEQILRNDGSRMVLLTNTYILYHGNVHHKQRWYIKYLPDSIERDSTYRSSMLRICDDGDSQKAKQKIKKTKEKGYWIFPIAFLL